MRNDAVTIEEFRKILTDQYIQKGVKPPIPGGEKEKQLYKSWIEGKQKLEGIS